MSLAPNPVIPGFAPDPSICRRGDDYYLVVSSFGYWPAIPVFHSTDLTSWHRIGHVADRANQLDLREYDLSDGVWAPTIRWYDGTFYVIVSIARGRRGERILIFTAADPSGDWSDPVELDAAGIDPSLFFDDDGRVWLTACRDAEQPQHGPAELFLQELDLQTLTLIGAPHVIWRGHAKDAWVEAPHLHKRAGRYHLIGAEGGTERNHAVTVASAEHLTGRFHSDPRNPVLTHRHLSADHPIQNVGHADLVETANGDTWAVVLGTRPIDGHHVLGRETFLVPVSWEAGRPVFAPGSGQVASLVEVPGAHPPAVPPAATDHFVSARLGDDWVSLRASLGTGAQPRVLGETGLRLSVATDLGDASGVPAFIGRRQETHCFTASTVILLSLLEASAAGIAVVQNEQRFVTALVERRANGDAQLRVTLRLDGETRIVDVLPVTRGSEAVRITVGSDGSSYWIGVTGAADPQLSEAGAPLPVGARVDAKLLSTESAGGFLGVVLGPYVEARGEHGSAVFTEFSSRGTSLDAASTDAHLASFTDAERRYSDVR